MSEIGLKNIEDFVLWAIKLGNKNSSTINSKLKKYGFNEEDIAHGLEMLYINGKIRIVLDCIEVI